MNKKRGRPPKEKHYDDVRITVEHYLTILDLRQEGKFEVSELNKNYPFKYIDGEDYPEEEAKLICELSEERYGHLTDSELYTIFRERKEKSIR